LRCRWIDIALLCLGIITACVTVAGAQPPQILGGQALVDQGGRTIPVPGPYHRIISLYGAHTENLFALGLDGQIIGVSRNDTFPPEVLDKPRFSYHDDPEKFLAARPDLVLIRPMIDRGYPQWVARLEQSGIRIVSLQPASIDSMYTYWEILGILTGKRARAVEMGLHFQRAVDAFRGLTRHVTAKKQVYFEAIHNKMKTFTPGAMAIFALETAGGVNIAADARQVRTTNIAFYGKERILAKADKIDVYLAQYGAMNRPSKEMIRNESGFHLIKAVQKDEVHIIDEMIISRPTFRLLEGIRRIGGILYPDIFDQWSDGIIQEAKRSKESS